jgi:hypothetical protein
LDVFERSLDAEDPVSAGTSDARPRSAIVAVAREQSATQEMQSRLRQVSRAELGRDHDHTRAKPESLQLDTAPTRHARPRIGARRSRMLSAAEDGGPFANVQECRSTQQAEGPAQSTSDSEGSSSSESSHAHKLLIIRCG